MGTTSRERVAALLESGLTPAQISRRLYLHRGTVYYHVKRLREG